MPRIATRTLNSRRAKLQGARGEEKMGQDGWNCSWSPLSAAPPPVPPRELESVSVCSPWTLPLPLLSHHYCRRPCRRNYCPSICPRSLKRSPQTESCLCSPTHNFCPFTYHRHHVTRTHAIGCQLCDICIFIRSQGKGRDLVEPWELKFEPR